MIDNTWEDAYLQLRRVVARPKKLARAISTWNLDRNAHIVDLCCGSGECFSVFKSAGYENLRGIDRSFRLLKAVGTIAVPLIQANAVKCPVKDNSFDVVFINKALHHFHDHVPVMAEIKRILKPHGYFCFIEPRDTWFRRLLYHIMFASPVINLFPPLQRLKKAALILEGKTYFYWMNYAQQFLKLLEEQFDFTIIACRKDLLHYMVKCRNNK